MSTTLPADGLNQSGKTQEADALRVRADPEGINRAGWAGGNSIVAIVTGSGRTAHCPIFTQLSAVAVRSTLSVYQGTDDLTANRSDVHLSG